jgi:hypothetical protein
VFFWVVSVFGLLFVLLQQRLHGFGSFALYLPWLVWVQRFGERHPPRQTATTVVVGLVLLAAYLPSIRYQLMREQPPAMDDRYASARPIFPVLAQACRERPGLVIADANDGHLIRYFTECSVIGNNFRLTPNDVAKYLESERLLSLPLVEVLREQPEARYVLGRLTAPDSGHPAFRGMTKEQVIATLRRSGPALFADLMLPPGADPAIVQPMLAVDARFSESQLVEHVMLFRVRATGPVSGSAIQ